MLLLPVVLLLLPVVLALLELLELEVEEFVLVLLLLAFLPFRRRTRCSLASALRD